MTVPQGFHKSTISLQNEESNWKEFWVFSNEINEMIASTFMNDKVMIFSNVNTMIVAQLGPLSSSFLRKGYWLADHDDASIKAIFVLIWQHKYPTEYT